MRVPIDSATIALEQGDICRQRVSAIVNPANEHLQLGAGVAGAIREQGGPGIQAECDRLGRCPVGEAVITGAGRLPSDYVIHAVGPQMGQGDEDALLRSAVTHAIRVAREHECYSIAFPAISTGVFGFPIDRCADISLAVAREHCRSGERPLIVKFVLFNTAAFEVFADRLRAIAADLEGGPDEA